jgi:ABC-type multidrug transport system ATPase subunit/pSer/pThr/pTyr-binding forkhead associated (FHA) protein
MSNQDHQFVFRIIEHGTILQEFVIDEDVELDIGREPSCSIVIEDSMISRFHALIAVRNNAVFVTDQGSANKTYIGEDELGPHIEYRLKEDTILEFADRKYAIQIQGVSDAVPAGYETPIVDESFSSIKELLRASKGKVLIGRSENADLVLDSLRVSRQHAIIEEKQGKLFVTDLNSKNGTFVNGIRIEGTVEVSPEDVVMVSTYKIALSEGLITDLRNSGDAIVAEKIMKKYPNGHVGLQEMSIKVPAKSFVALMGPSGCGKSTLLKGLNGANPVSRGEVLVHGLPLNKKNFNKLRRSIGYVPQDDIVHRDLTVDRTMYYAAKLRMADDVSEAEIAAKIDQVLSSLNINDKEIRKNRVGKLSGGQRKRVSIAVELLHDPTILFLDEPTSPLDPETIGDFLECIQNLSRNGVTTIMVTHKPSDLEYVDKVIFLSAGGYLAYYGIKDKLTSYFEQKNLIGVYSLLKEKSDGKRWNQKWKLSNPLSEIEPLQESLNRRTSESFLKQFFWLSRRYLSIKWSDKGNILLLFAQPVIIAVLISFIFNLGLEVGVLFLVAVSAIWFGVSNAAKEIVSEIPIYERERMFNMSIWSYLLSKIIVLSIIAFFQIVIFMGILHLNYNEWGVPEDYGDVIFRGFVDSTAFVFYLSVSATLFGLVLSSLFKTTEKVMTVVPIALIPQIMLAGVVATIDNGLKDILSFFTLGRWGTEGLGQIQDDQSREATSTIYRADSTEVFQSIISPEPVFDTSYIVCPNVEDMTRLDSIQIQQPTEETVYRPDEALRILNLHGDGTLGWFPDAFSSTMMAITALNVICIVIIYFALKSKDKIL